MNNKDYRIYLDLEYVYPEMTKEYGRPTGKNLRQVIQIAAIKVDVKTNNDDIQIDIETGQVKISEYQRLYPNIIYTTVEYYDDNED